MASAETKSEYIVRAKALLREDLRAQSWPEKVRAIRQQIEALVPPGTDIHTPTGPIGRTVCTLARELGTGLISLGVHKHSFARELFGTALLEILLNAPCPVLSVRQCD